MSLPDAPSPGIATPAAPEPAAGRTPRQPVGPGGRLDRLRLAALGRQGGHSTPLIPAASIAGRSLVMVIAIMTFLAAMTAGSVKMIAGASADWSSSIAREATIQVKPRAGRNMEADLFRSSRLAGAIPPSPQPRSFRLMLPPPCSSPGSARGSKARICDPAPDRIAAAARWRLS